MKSRQKVSTHEVAHFPERMPMWMVVDLAGAGHFYEFMLNGIIREELCFILW